MCVQAQSLQLCPTLCNPVDCNPQSSSDYGDSPGKNTGVSCHVLLQGIFLTWWSNLHLLVSPPLQVDFLPTKPCGKPGSISGSGRSPGEGNGSPFQYSCLENPMDRGARQATVHRVTRVGYNLVTKLPSYIYI